MYLQTCKSHKRLDLQIGNPQPLQKVRKSNTILKSANLRICDLHLW
jgi:hypothetical protein